MDCSPLGSSVHGIFQARILEWVAAIPFFRGSSWSRDWTWVSTIAGGFFFYRLSHQGSSLFKYLIILLWWIGLLISACIMGNWEKVLTCRWKIHQFFHQLQYIYSIMFLSLFCIICFLRVTALLPLLFLPPPTIKTHELLSGFYEFFIYDRFSEIGKSVLVMLLDFSEAVYF